MILKQLTVGSMGVCCYIIGCTKTGRGAIVDPGGGEKTVLETARGMGLTIDYIIATHGHPDHVCGNRIIQEATGAKIVMHEDDAAFFFKKEIQNYFSMLGLEQSPPVDITVKDGDSLTLGEEQLRIIHTPGHTPGGICLYNPPDLITGDTLFVGGIGRTDFPGGSHQQLIDSILGRLMVLPEETVIWPGHGYGGSRSTLGEEKRENPYIC
ncbi:MAG: MBL fold metallo-hydrolase [Desulfocapsaceae bacterium]|nr:MBL fold metallo-hydrolase [Desulfocapsaceae bacterium]